MESEITITIKNITDMSQRVEVIFYSLHVHHGLFVVIDSQSLILNTLRCNLYSRKMFHFKEQGVISSHGLTFSSFNLQLWVEIGEEWRNKVGESIEST